MTGITVFLKIEGLLSIVTGAARCALLLVEPRRLRLLCLCPKKRRVAIRASETYRCDVLVMAESDSAFFLRLKNYIATAYPCRDASRQQKQNHYCRETNFHPYPPFQTICSGHRYTIPGEYIDTI